jgi:hypothetical protein
VRKSGQRIDKLHKLQFIENTALNLDDRTTYDVVTDNATRWNSSEAMMERGYCLRNALDSLVQAEVTEWNQYVTRRTQNGTKMMPKKSRKKPAIVDDKMSADDWSVIADYLAILKPLKTATERLEGRPEEGERNRLPSLTSRLLTYIRAIWRKMGSAAHHGVASKALGRVQIAAPAR